MSKKSKKVTVEARVAVLTDCPEAMEFVEQREIPIYQIYQEPNGNSARSSGYVTDHIKKFENLIRKGKYAPHHNIPPIVIELAKGDPRRLNENGEEQYLYLLVAGHHRFAAHIAQNKTFFYAQVVEFKPARGKTALHWLRLYQIKENLPEDEEFIRSTATNGDIAMSIVGLINIRKDSDANHPTIDVMIAEFLKTFGIVATGKVKTITNMIHRNLGNVAKVVQGITETARDKFLDMFRTTKNKRKDNVIYNNFVPGEKNVEDYDYRCISKVWDRIDDDPKCLSNLAIVAGTTKANHREVLEVRKKKSKLFKNYADKVIAQVAYLMGVSVNDILRLKKGNNYEKFSNIGIHWMPQLHGESEKVKSTNELIVWEVKNV